GGSALDATPYQLRADAPAVKNPYTRQNFGATTGGPVKTHGICDGTRRTNFVVTYNGSRGSNLFDQYATVPTAAMRAGDFSLVNAPLIDPATGQPFPNNQIPVDRISPTSLALLDYYPLPNLGGLTQNFHRVDTVSSVNDTLNVRVTHNFTPAAAGGGRGGGGRGGVRAGRRARRGRTRRGRRRRRSGGRRPGRARPGAGDGRQHDRAVAVPPQRQRSAQRAARARRPHVGRQPRRPRVVQHPAPSDDAHGERELLVDLVAEPEQLRQHAERRRRCGHRRRVGGSLRLRPAGAVVLDVSRRARRDAVAPQRQARGARLQLDAAVEDAPAARGRRFPAG